MPTQAAPFSTRWLTKLFGTTWRQFLWYVIVVGVFLWWKSGVAEQQRQSLNELEQQYGYWSDTSQFAVAREGSPFWYSVWDWEFWQTPLGASVAGWIPWTDVREVTNIAICENCVVQEQILQHSVALRFTQVFVIEKTMSTAAYDSMTQLPNLEFVNATNLTDFDRFCDALEDLPQVTRVYISADALSDQQLQRLKKFRYLKWLSVSQDREVSRSMKNELREALPGTYVAFLELKDMSNGN